MERPNYNDFDKFIIFLCLLVFIVILTVSVTKTFNYSVLIWGGLLITSLFLPIIRSKAVTFIWNRVDLWTIKVKAKRQEAIKRLKNNDFEEEINRDLWLAYGELFSDQPVENTMFNSYITKQKNKGISRFRFYLDIYFLIPRAFAFQVLGIVVSSGMSLEPWGHSIEYVMYQKKKWDSKLSVLNYFNPFWWLGFIMFPIFFRRANIYARKQLLSV
ncbi:hypothetical protein [Bermanella sp. R86510]|uniref:hypothetical protein n=1 Tax=unclassified Bermanella TaxID=2627862 RepID=UPI0037C57570